MTTIGIICEYNPFHNGHIYHIKKIKELYKDSIIILVMSGNFLQRGDTSLINKWDKTKIALNNNIDLVVELPFVFATQSADIFAHGAIQILNELKVDKLVFGSECDNIELLKDLANIQINNKKYENLIKKYTNDGYNYPTAMSIALKDLGKKEINNPNDILGLCYIKEIIKQKSNIEPITIKRTSNYHSTALNTICSATAIRESIKNNKDITNYVPNDTIKYIKNCFIDSYYELIKYKIITCKNLEQYETVDNNIKYRINKYIYTANTLQELIDKVKTKRYTYNRIKRMLIHILCDFTKEENKKCKDIHYIRILGFNNKGRNYLKKIKKQCTIPIISNFSKIKDIMLDIEFRATCIYSLSNNQEIASEYKNKPIIKK